ncbi:hypothetical protein MUK42_34741 [Musa troglodytarum]|uniref:Uncharacterized protein n=1 Tax=Musa troglodytarum TaxID=320322 RepID=A0A9E7EAE5_9LILI|nr:hypothetical protein MUK42_34741 [Musa troglodytarum]
MTALPTARGTRSRQDQSLDSRKTKIKGKHFDAFTGLKLHQLFSSLNSLYAEADTTPEGDESVGSSRWIDFQMTAPTYNFVNPFATSSNAATCPRGEVSERGKGGREFEFGRRKVKPWEGERIHNFSKAVREVGIRNGFL